MAAKTFEQYLAESGRQAELDALRAKADGSFERAKAAYETGDAGITGDPATDYINKIIDSITAPLKQANERAGQFDSNNPFSFDELLAKQSAEERLSPYYESELRDYVSGANRARGRTMQDEQRLRRELDITTETTSGRLKQDIQETIKSTEEGFASSGLLNSGARERATGITDTRGSEDLSSYLRGQDYTRNQSVNRESRNLEDIAAGQNTYQRKLSAEQATSLTTDVEQQRQQALAKRELERQNYIGYPLGGGTQSVNSFLQYI